MDRLGRSRTGSFLKKNESFTFFPNDPSNKSNKEIGGVWTMLKDKSEIYG
jgi:hypothetical protein